MSRRKRNQANPNKRNVSNNYNFFLTNAFGSNREHFGLQVSEDDKNWTFLTLTHSPTGHYRLKKDPLTGKDNPQSSFLNTSLKTKSKATRLREDKTRKICDEDKTNLIKLIEKKPAKGQSGTSHTSDRQIQPRKRDQISAKHIKSNKKR